LKAENVLEKVQYLRRLHPKMGTRKLHYILAKFHDISMGRDALFTLLGEYDLLVKRRRKSRYYSPVADRTSNKIKDIEIDRPGQVMVADMTYLKTRNRDYYLSLVTDAYSRKIIGFNLSGSLAAAETLRALEQAIDESGYNYKIHHSDGGVQYTCKEYQQYLEKQNITPSMTRPASPQENPIAERVNGILKHEYGLEQHFETYEDMLAKTKRAINIYNNIRPHWALKLNIPNIVHQQKLSTIFRT
jgi:putative transposase